MGGGMRIALGLMLLLVSMASVRAEDQTVEFAGETYHLDYQDRAKHPDGSSGDGVAEFTLEGETVNDWTKLFAYHIYPDVPADPALAAETLGKTVKENNKDANYSLTKDDKSGEAIVDFLTWAPGSDVMEFNVFKYAKAGDGQGLIALQYAQRFKSKDIPVEEFRKLRERMVAEMAHTDAQPARDYFAGGDEDDARSPD
jgi:hypothetical protein